MIYALVYEEGKIDAHVKFNIDMEQGRAEAIIFKTFTESDIQTLRASFERIWPHNEYGDSNHNRLLKKFYGDFFLKCPEAEALFSNSDMKTQLRMLFTALKSVLYNLENHEEMEKLLTELKTRHIDYGVVNSHYPIFAKCLLDSIRETDSEHWNSNHEALWSSATQMVCSHMAE